MTQKLLLYYVNILSIVQSITSLSIIRPIEKSIWMPGVLVKFYSNSVKLARIMALMNSKIKTYYCCFSFLWVKQPIIKPVLVKSYLMYKSSIMSSFNIFAINSLKFVKFLFHYMNLQNFFNYQIFIFKYDVVSCVRISPTQIHIVKIIILLLFFVYTDCWKYICAVCSKERI